MPCATSSMPRGIFSSVSTVVYFATPPMRIAPPPSARQYSASISGNCSLTMYWMPKLEFPSSPASERKMTSRSSGMFDRFSRSIVISPAVRLSLSSTVPRAYTQPPSRVALNGGNFHLDSSTVTTSLWPMMRSGRFRPFPFRRATTFERFGSSARIFAGIPSLSNTCLRYSAARCSLPGGLRVSMRSTAWNWRIVSSSTAFQSGSFGACAASAATATTAMTKALPILPVQPMSLLLSLIFRVRDILEPLRAAAKPDVDLHQRLPGRGTMPMHDVSGGVIAFADAIVLDRLAALLRAHAPFRHHQQLAAVVAVPRRPRTRLESAPRNREILALQRFGLAGEARRVAGRLLRFADPARADDEQQRE